MKLSTVIVASILFAFTTSVAHAAEKKKKVVESEPKKGVAETPKTSSYGGESEINMTACIGAVDGNFVYGPGFEQEWPVTLEGNRFAVGWQTGFYYTSTSENVFGLGELKSKVWGIPILVSGKYLFDTGIDFLKPYIAIS